LSYQTIESNRRGFSEVSRTWLSKFEQLKSSLHEFEYNGTSPCQIPLENLFLSLEVSFIQGSMGPRQGVHSNNILYSRVQWSPSKMDTVGEFISVHIHVLKKIQRSIKYSTINYRGVLLEGLCCSQPP